MHANCAYGSMAPLPFDESLPDGPYTPELDSFQAQDGDSLRLSDSLRKVILQTQHMVPGCSKDAHTLFLPWIRSCEHCTCKAVQTARFRIPAAVCPCTRAGSPRGGSPVLTVALKPAEGSEHPSCRHLRGAHRRLSAR